MADPGISQTDHVTSVDPAIHDNTMVDERDMPNRPGKKKRGRDILLRGLQHMSSSPSLSRVGRARSASSPYSVSTTLSCVSLASTSSPFGQPSMGSYFSQSSAAGNWSDHTSIPTSPIAESPSQMLPEDMLAVRVAESAAPVATTASVPSTVKRKMKSFNLWENMPHELKIHILSFLRPKELVRASRVSKEFHDMCFDGQLWARLDTSEFYRDITAEALAKIVVSAGPFVKDLNLRGCLQVEHDHKTEAMVDACQNLVNATLEGCRTLKRPTLHRLIRTNNKLAYLNLTGLSIVSNTTCEIIAESCPQLEVLNVSWCKHMDAGGIHKIIESCPKLRDLRAGEVKGFNNTDLAEAIFRTNNLERLVLPGCDDLDDKALITMVQGRNPEIDVLTDIPMVPPRRLRHLDLSRCSRLSNHGIKALAHLVPDLQGLQLAGFAHLHTEGLAPVLATTPRLTHLELEECAELTNAILSPHLANAPCAPHLQHLGIGYCERLGDKGILPVLRACTSLRSVVMDNTRISDLALAEAAAMVRERSVRRVVSVAEGEAPPKPVITLNLVVYDCVNVTWTGVREVLSRNADPPPSPAPSQATPHPAVTTTTTTTTRPQVQKEIISLKCFHNYQQTVDEHTKRVLANNLVAARRLERKWAEYMQANVEAEAGVSMAGGRRRRRRARAAMVAHGQEENNGNAADGGGNNGVPGGNGNAGGENTAGGGGAGGGGGGGNGGGTGAGGGAGLVGRRRARTTACIVM
ncbi:hypothetical protein VTJ49DRAFT_5773 [Mycothermus thermophilus]|uniref:F-box domain-containing protein n=1 Tax=Humicola insolens TaxID=85995 RepID=A0ABR3VQV2_HUMIN